MTSSGAERGGDRAAQLGAGAGVRVLVVDDEPLARRGVRARLAAIAGVEVVGECADGVSAVEAARALRPDVVFLDVRMPGLDGFGVVDALAREVGAEAMPAIVFLTAFDQHAIRAFEAQALDYLLKPVDEARFARALARARARVAEQRASALGRRVAAAVLTEVGVPAPGPSAATGVGQPAARWLAHLLVDRGGRTLVVAAADVDWIAADGDYVRLHVGREAHLLRDTMARLEARLDPARFARVHRSAIVNVACIRELLPHANREAVLVLRDGARLKVSRGYRDRLDALLDDRL